MFEPLVGRGKWRWRDGKAFGGWVLYTYSRGEGDEGARDAMAILLALFNNSSNRREEWSCGEI